LSPSGDFGKNRGFRPEEIAVSSEARTAAARILALAVAVVLAAGAAAAQSATDAAPGTVNVEVDPIRCWWRTSAGAVRVGEPFEVVLTCAVIENALTVVSPDQSRLEPTALQLPPFEVIGGTHFPDSRTADRRFFQYEYRVRLIQDDAFGIDAPLPEVEITYRIRTRTPDGSSVEGRELSYILPPAAVRVLSLVPAGASDIRDATGETFNDLSAQAFRANVLRVVAGLLFSLGAVMAVLVLIRLGRTVFRSEETTSQLLPDTVVLRGTARELEEVKQLRQHQDWSDESAERVLAALRIVGTYALSRRTNQIVAPEKAQPREGHLLFHGGWLSGRQVLASGSVTAATVGQALVGAEPGDERYADLEQLQIALMRFAAVQYGREDAGLDGAALDASLEHGLGMARRLAVQHFWPVRKLRALTETASQFRRRVWSR
jgi:hypothetical protein